MRLSKIEYAILDILRSGREVYGLEMIRESNGMLKTGTIYVTLGRMTDKKYVTSRAEEIPNYPGMPRRLYRISGLGEQALREADQAAMEAAGGLMV